jgi:hypothetical protein
MAAARASSRWGHRDATMILIGYRHDLRASELCDLQRSQVELNAGRLHVRRAKNGSPSVQIRALRRLQREQEASPFVFCSERRGPMTPKAFHALFGRIGERAKMPFPIHPHVLRHGCGYALANAGHELGRCKPISVTRIFSTPCATRSLRRIGSRISGANGPVAPLRDPLVRIASGITCAAAAILCANRDGRSDWVVVLCPAEW